jgi:hypothetical protein
MNAALLLAIFQSIPVLHKLLTQIIDLYFTQINATEQKQMSDVQRQRDALVSAIKQPGLTNEERRTLRHSLYKLHRL